MSIDKKKIVISACIFGFPFKYDGKSCKREEILKKLKKEYLLIPLCPEILAGLSLKRNPCSRLNYNIVENETGEDKTHFFKKGAERALKIVKENKVKKALLKEKSPSCGVNFVHYFIDKGKTEVKRGKGIFTEMLEKEGIEVQGIE